MANLQSQIDILAKAIIRNFADDRRMVESFGGGIEDYNPFDVIYQNEYEILRNQQYENTLYDLSYLNENHELIEYSDTIKEYVYQDVKNEITKTITNKIINTDGEISYIELTPDEIIGENSSITIKNIGKTLYKSYKTNSDGIPTEIQYDYYGKITFNGETKLVRFTKILKNNTDYFTNGVESIITITDLKLNEGGWSGKINGDDITISSIICVDTNEEWSNTIKVKFIIQQDESGTISINTETYSNNNVYIPISEEIDLSKDSTNGLFKITLEEPTITETNGQRTLKADITYLVNPNANPIPIPIHDQKYQTRLTNVGEKLKGVEFPALKEKLHKYGPINTYDISCINVEGWNFMNKISVNEETVHNITDGENYVIFNQNNGIATINTEDEIISGYKLTINDTNASFTYNNAIIYLLGIKDWITTFNDTCIINDYTYEFVHILKNISLSEDNCEALIETTLKNTEGQSDTEMEIKNVTITFSGNNNPFLNIDNITDNKIIFTYDIYTSDKYAYKHDDDTIYTIDSLELPAVPFVLDYDKNEITIKYADGVYSLILKNTNNVKITSKITAELTNSNKEQYNLKLTLKKIRHTFRIRNTGDTHHLNNIISCTITNSTTNSNTTGTDVPVYVHLAENPLREFTSSDTFYINNIKKISENKLSGIIEGQPVIIEYLDTNVLERIIELGYIVCSDGNITTDGVNSMIKPKTYTQDYVVSNSIHEWIYITIEKIYYDEKNRYPVFNTFLLDDETEDTYEITTLTYDSVNNSVKCEGNYTYSKTTTDGNTETVDETFTCYITSIVKKQIGDDNTSTIKELTTTHKNKNYYFAETRMAKFPCNYIIDKNGYIYSYYYPDEENNAFSNRKNKYSHFNGLKPHLFENIKPSHQYNLVTGIFRSDAGSTGTEEQCFNYYVVKNLLQNVVGCITSNYGDINIFENVESRLLNLFTPISEKDYPSKGKFSEKSTSSLCMYVTNGSILTNTVIPA